MMTQALKVFCLKITAIMWFTFYVSARIHCVIISFTHLQYLPWKNAVSLTFDAKIIYLVVLLQREFSLSLRKRIHNAFH